MHATPFLCIQHVVTTVPQPLSYKISGTSAAAVLCKSGHAPNVLQMLRLCTDALQTAPLPTCCAAAGAAAAAAPLPHAPCCCAPPSALQQQPQLAAANSKQCGICWQCHVRQESGAAGIGRLAALLHKRGACWQRRLLSCHQSHGRAYTKA